MPKQIISTNKAPEAIGPYSQAVRVGEQIYCSGQIPLRADGSLVDGSIEQQTEQVMENIKEILKAANSSLENIIKITIYLTDLSNFDRVNQVYGEYFTDKPPARATIQVAALPKGAEIEIEAISTIK